MGVNKKKNLKDLYLEKISVEDSIKRKNEMSEAGYWDLTINDMIAKIVEIESESECKNSMKINQITMEENDIKEYESEEKRSFIKHEGIIGKDVVGEGEIIEYIKSLNVKIRGSNLDLIKLSVNDHGGENVKAAIDKALEVDRPRMNYINGILNNWKIEGYPESSTDSRKKGSIHKQDKYKILRFNNFEPRNYDYEKLEKELLGWERA